MARFIPGSVLAFVLTATLAACGGGSGGGLVPPTSIPEVPTNAAGIWDGTINSALFGTALEVVGAVVEGNADARFVTEAGVALVLGNLEGTNGNITASMTAYAPPNTTFADGSTVSTGSLSGSVVERSSLTGEWSLVNGDSGTVSMQYDALYERGSSIDLLFGFWLDSFGVLYTVDLNGDILAQDALGCVYNGVANIIDSRYNVYGLTLNVSNCPGVDGDYTGLGVLADEFGIDDAFIVQFDNGQLATADLLLRQ